MKIWDKKETIQTGTHKSTLDLQKIERDKRQKRREECREKDVAFQRRMNTRVIEHEENPPESVHDRHEEGVDDEEVSPMEEYLWIEQREALQVQISEDVRPLSPKNINLSARVQGIVREDLILRGGEYDIQS